MVVIYRITWLHYIESVSMDDMVSDNYQRLYSQHTTNQASGNGDIKNLISHIRTVQTKAITKWQVLYYGQNNIVKSRSTNSFHIIWNSFHYNIRYFHHVRTIFG